MGNAIRIGVGVMGVVVGICIAYAAEKPTSRPAPEPAAGPSTRPAALTGEQTARLRKLIADLASVKFDVRRAAADAIRGMGPGALPEVSKHIDDEDAEVADQCERIAAYLDLQIPVSADELKMTVSVQPAELKVGQRIQVQIRIANGSTKPASIPGFVGQSTRTLQSSIQLTDPDGKRVEGFLCRPAAVTSAMLVVPSHGQKPLNLLFTVDRSPAVASAAASRPAADAYLVLADRNLHFPLAKPGQYTLKLVVDMDRLPDEDLKAPTAGIQTAGPDGSVGIQSVPLFSGALESNSVTLHMGE